MHGCRCSGGGGEPGRVQLCDVPAVPIFFDVCEREREKERERKKECM